MYMLLLLILVFSAGIVLSQKIKDLGNRVLNTIKTKINAFKGISSQTPNQVVPTPPTPPEPPKAV